MSLYGAVDLTVFKDDICRYCKIILKNHQIFLGGCLQRAEQSFTKLNFID